MKLDENIAILLRYKGGMPGYPGEVLAASKKRLFAYEVEPIFLDCFATNIDWMQDEKRLFVSLDTGDEHVTSEESYQRVGTDIIQEGQGSKTARNVYVGSS